MQTTQERGRKKRSALSSARENVLEALGMGLARLDDHMNIVEVDARAAEVLGAGAGELEGRTLADAFPEDLAVKVSGACREALVSGCSVYCEGMPGEPPGKWISCRCLGRGRGFVLLIEDMARRKTVREAGPRSSISASMVGRVYELLPMSMCLVDRDLRVVTANSHFSKMSGRPGKEIPGRPLQEVVPAPAGRMGSLARTVFESGRALFGVDIAEVPDIPGVQARSWLTYWLPVTDGQGTVRAVNIAWQNITELRDTLKALRDSEERYRLLHDTLMQGVIEFDGQGRVLSANPAAEETTGLELSEMCGRDFGELVALLPEVRCEGGPSRDAALSRVWSSKPGEPVKGLVMYFLHKKTRQGRWISADSIPRFASGKERPGGWFVIFSDITELKRAQELLKEAGRRREEKMRGDIASLESAVEHAGEGIVLFNRSLGIEYVNSAFESLSGYRRDELVGKDIESLGGYFLGDEYRDILRKIVDTGEPWSGHRKRRHRSGKVMEVNLTLSPVQDEAGSVISYVAVVRDITGEVKDQRQLAEIRRMEDAGLLAEGIARDLEGVFAPILRNTRDALKQLHEGSPARPMIEESRRAALLGSELIRQMVTLSRRHTRGRYPVDIVPLVSEAVAFLRSALPRTIEIRHRGGKARLPVLADPFQIKQVLINLGDNAGYAMRGTGGLLEVSTGRARLSARAAERISPGLARGPYARIVVRDTGEGMDKYTRDHALDPFFTTREPVPGSGLGLAIVSGIIRDHRGAVTIESSPGKGAAFTLLLPLLEEEEPLTNAG
jgi:PAS domain S-box-containing protein